MLSCLEYVPMPIADALAIDWGEYMFAYHYSQFAILRDSGQGLSHVHKGWGIHFPSPMTPRSPYTHMHPM